MKELAGRGGRFQRRGILFRTRGRQKRVKSSEPGVEANFSYELNGPDR